MPASNDTVANKRGKAKMTLEIKRRASIEKLTRLGDQDPDIRTQLIQELIPLGLKAVTEELQQEVRRLAGDRYDRGSRNLRWGAQNGSIYLRDQKLPIRVPRVRSRNGEEVPLESYTRMQQPFVGQDQTVLKLLHGLSTHRYHESAALAPEVFGLSASTLSKRFQGKTAGTLRQLQTRNLASCDFVAVFIDGKRYADDGIMVALGVTLDGKKMILGIEQIHSENSKAIDEWLGKLVSRGLKFDEGMLFVIDGSKGIKKAVQHRAGEFAVIQRCQWHKRENVASYLDEHQKILVRNRMKHAYRKTTYEEAKNELLKLHTELTRVNESAAASLLEGLEETLTLHTLGLAPELIKHLGTTNQIESVMSQLGQYTDKVDRWHNSNQILRWTAEAAMDLEPRLRRVRGFRYLGMLKTKLKEIVLKRQSVSAKERELIEVS